MQMLEIVAWCLSWFQRREPGPVVWAIIRPDGTRDVVLIKLDDRAGGRKPAV